MTLYLRRRFASQLLERQEATSKTLVVCCIITKAKVLIVQVVFKQSLELVGR
jgi:hypothetical protein